LGGNVGGTEEGSPPSLPSSLPSPAFLPSLSYPPFPFPPLEVGPLNPARGVWGSAVSSRSGVWGGVPAGIECGAF